eukprot:Nitzschia sp. Nitz4//scaffold240_size29840//7457//9650//NITZ4_008016-RA/size29840-augustus-gene-0.31-mRNA-1//-1//CDS//3329543744//6128//frame0
MSSSGRVASLGFLVLPLLTEVSGFVPVAPLLGKWVTSPIMDLPTASQSSVRSRRLFEHVGDTSGADDLALQQTSTNQLNIVQDSDAETSAEEELDEQQIVDNLNMKLACEIAMADGGETGPTSAYPQATTGAVLVGGDSTILGWGRSDYSQDSVQAALKNAGLEITPLQEWCVTWPASDELRSKIANATLYLTLEPSSLRHGQALPPITQLIELSGVRRVVIGCADPSPDRASSGAKALHEAGLEVVMGRTEVEACQELIKDYSKRATGKLQRMARKHAEQFNRPLGFMHCSVVDSDNLEAFANHGNAFGKEFDGKRLSFRDFGAYEIAPPPEVIWADSHESGDEPEEDAVGADDNVDLASLDFDDEDEQELLGGTPMMPWYEQVDAVVATFPHAGSGPVENTSITSRLNGLKWLSTHGRKLPAGVERILVMDATDLTDLPLTNDDPNLPKGVDVESFWRGDGRKPTRVLLQRGRSAQAKSAASAAAAAASAAAKAAIAAQEAIETGDAETAAQAAVEGQQAAAAASELAQKELMKTLELKQKLASLGTVVETLNGGEPIDVMNHLGVRNGYNSVVWRAGCWSNRGVKSILAGAFQWVSAHLAVDAIGGKFWQLMLAERAVQGACGPESRVKVFAGQEDISLEYCDEPEADSDCSVSVAGKPVRHVRLDCRVALVDPDRDRNIMMHRTKPIDRKVIEEEAPWFL